MTLLGARHFKMRHAIELAMMTASFAAGGEAMADCAPAGPVNNTIVTVPAPDGRLRAGTRVHLELDAAVKGLSSSLATIARIGD